MAAGVATTDWGYRPMSPSRGPDTDLSPAAGCWGLPGAPRGSHGPGLLRFRGSRARPSSWPCVRVWFVCEQVCAKLQMSMRGRADPRAHGRVLTCTQLEALEFGVTSTLCGSCAVLAACLSHGAGRCRGSCWALWSTGLCRGWGADAVRAGGGLCDRRLQGLCARACQPARTASGSGPPALPVFEPAGLAAL